MASAMVPETRFYIVEINELQRARENTESQDNASCSIQKTSCDLSKAKVPRVLNLVTDSHSYIIRIL